MVEKRFPSVTINEVHTSEGASQRKHLDVRFSDVNDWQIAGLKMLAPELVDLVDSVRTEDLKRRAKHLARAYRPFDLVEPELHMRKGALYLKNAFLKEVKIFRPGELARLIGIQSLDAAEQIRKWRDEQVILGVDFEGRDLYPSFQFDSNGQPYPIVKELIKTLVKDGSADWSIAIWFFCGNGWLDGDSPMDVLQANDPQASELLLDAAQQEVLEDGH